MTIDPLKASESELRQLAGGMLKPRPWKHLWTGYKIAIDRCSKCNDLLRNNSPPVCSVPDPAEGPWEVIADQLARKCDPERLSDELSSFFKQSVDWDQTFIEWIRITPIDRVRVCLLAREENPTDPKPRGWSDCHSKEHNEARPDFNPQPGW